MWPDDQWLETNHYQTSRAMKKDLDDHAVSVFKAIVAGIPFVGGPVSSLLGDYMPNRTLETVQCSLEYLRYRTEVLEGRIDADAFKDTVKKDEFSEIFKSCYLVTVRSHKKQKLEAAMNIVANTLLREDDQERLAFTEADHFSRGLELMSLGSIHVLKAIYDVVDQCLTGGLASVGIENAENERLVAFQNLQEIFGELYYDSLLMGLLRDLDSLNFVNLVGGAVHNEKEDYSGQIIELTVLGARFVATVLNPDNNAQLTV